MAITHHRHEDTLCGAGLRTRHKANAVARAVILTNILILILASDLPAWIALAISARILAVWIAITYHGNLDTGRNSVCVRPAGDLVEVAGQAQVVASPVHVALSSRRSGFVVMYGHRLA